MTDFIIAGILLIIIGAAVAYIIKAKKSGVKCIGYPEGSKCSGKCSGGSESGCGCHCNTQK